MLDSSMRSSAGKHAVVMAASHSSARECYVLRTVLGPWNTLAKVLGSW